MNTNFQKVADEEIKSLVENNAWNKILFYFVEDDSNYNLALARQKLTLKAIIKNIIKTIKETKSIKETVSLLIKSIVLKKTTIEESQLNDFLDKLLEILGGNKKKNENKDYCQIKIQMYSDNPGMNLELIRLMEGVPNKANLTDILRAHCNSAVLSKELIVFLLRNGANLDDKMSFFNSTKISDYLDSKNIKFIYSINAIGNFFSTRAWAFTNERDNKDFYFNKIQQFILPFDNKNQTELHRWCGRKITLTEISYEDVFEKKELKENVLYLWGDFQNPSDTTVHFKFNQYNDLTYCIYGEKKDRLSKIEKIFLEKVEKYDKFINSKIFLSTFDNLTLQSFILSLAADLVAIQQINELLKHLVKFNNNDININSQDKNGNTALHLYLQGENVSFTVVKLLIENGASLSILNHNSETPFDCLKRNLAVTVEFLQACLFHSIEQCDIERSKVLLEIAKIKNFALPNLLKRTVEINTSMAQTNEFCHELEMTPLRYACGCDSLPHVRFLLEHNADPNITYSENTKYGEFKDSNALAKLINNTKVEKSNSFQIASYLLAYGINFEVEYHGKWNTNISSLVLKCQNLKVQEKINDFTDLADYIPSGICEFLKQQSIKHSQQFIKDNFSSFEKTTQKCIYTLFACCKIEKFKIKPLISQFATEALVVDVKEFPKKLKRDILLAFLTDNTRFPNSQEVLNWLDQILTLEKSENNDNTPKLGFR